MRRQRREHDDAAGAHRNRRRVGAVVLTANVASLAPTMLQSSAQVPAWNDPRTSVLEGGIGERDPAGEVRLRLDEGVAVILMPRKMLRVLGLFVNRLIPIETHVGSDEIVTQ